MDISQVISQLERLKGYCKEFADTHDEPNIWEDDVQALDKAIEVLRKEIPKKVESIHKRGVWNCGYCPCCKNTAYGNYCPHCGQKLNWEE